MRRHRRQATGESGVGTGGSAPPAPPASPAPVAPWTARRHAVEERLVAAVGDRSLCDISRAGAPGGVKDLEGRMAALAEVDRAVRAGAAPVAAVRAALGDWRRRVAADVPAGPAWAAYRRGGLDELEELSTEIGGD